MSTRIYSLVVGPLLIYSIRQVVLTFRGDYTKLCIQDLTVFVVHLIIYSIRQVMGFKPEKAILLRPCQQDLTVLCLYNMDFTKSVSTRPNGLVPVCHTYFKMSQC